MSSLSGVWKGISSIYDYVRTDEPAFQYEIYFFWTLVSVGTLVERFYVSNFSRKVLRSRLRLASEKAAFTSYIYIYIYIYMN